jgi:GntR family transcriptional repressor for pyruvate dehydrogenase complex
LDSGTPQPVKIPKAAALVAADLRHRIVRGELAEGDALPNETELMGYFSVSRPTLREALRILESESLISVKRGARGGARVTVPDAGVTARHAALVLQLQGTTLEDVFEARAIIEPAAVRLIAKRQPDGALAKLRQCHEEERRVIGDPVAYPLAAARFHEQIIELSGNRTLTLLALVTVEIVAAHNQATFAALEQTQPVFEDADLHHAKLLDYIEAGDAEAAADLWQVHLEGAAAIALESLGPHRRVDLLDLRP